jgi:hypothetical protein
MYAVGVMHGDEPSGGKRRLEVLVCEEGGTVVQHPTAMTHGVIADEGMGSLGRWNRGAWPEGVLTDEDEGNACQSSSEWRIWSRRARTTSCARAGCSNAWTSRRWCPCRRGALSDGDRTRPVALTVGAHRHLIFATATTRRKMARHADAFGDSYTDDVTADALREVR